MIQATHYSVKVIVGGLNVHRSGSISNSVCKPLCFSRIIIDYRPNTGNMQVITNQSLGLQSQDLVCIVSHC